MILWLEIIVILPIMTVKSRVTMRTLYRSVRDGDLKVVAPHGAKRGWRVLDAELRRWLGCS